jgi:hypothetical protein
VLPDCSKLPVVPQGTALWSLAVELAWRSELSWHWSESQHRKGIRPQLPVRAAHDRRSDRTKVLFASVHESGGGPELKLAELPEWECQQTFCLGHPATVAGTERSRMPPVANYAPGEDAWLPLCQGIRVESAADWEIGRGRRAQLSAVRAGRSAPALPAGEPWRRAGRRAGELGPPVEGWAPWSGRAGPPPSMTASTIGTSSPSIGDSYPLRRLKPQAHENPTRGRFSRHEGVSC